MRGERTVYYCIGKSIEIRVDMKYMNKLICTRSVADLSGCMNCIVLQDS